MVLCHIEKIFQTCLKMRITHSTCWQLHNLDWKLHFMLCFWQLPLKIRRLGLQNTNLENEWLILLCQIKVRFLFCLFSLSPLHSLSPCPPVLYHLKYRTELLNPVMFNINGCVFLCLNSNITSYKRFYIEVHIFPN